MELAGVLNDRHDGEFFQELEEAFEPGKTDDQRDLSAAQREEDELRNSEDQENADPNNKNEENNDHLGEF